MIVVQPVVELNRLDCCVFAAFLDVCSPLGQCASHLIGIMKVFQLCEIININAVFLKWCAISRVVTQCCLETTCRFFVISLSVVYQTFDKFRSCESVLVASFGGVVVYLLYHIYSLAVFATETVFLAQHHPCVIVIRPQLMLATEIQNLWQLHLKRIVDIVVVVICQDPI